jgi:hypothetical protein
VGTVTAGHSSSGLTHVASSHFLRPQGQVDLVGHFCSESTQVLKSEGHRS